MATGPFSPAAYNVGTNPQGILAADINADGFLDIVTANQGANSASLLLGNGNGTFATHADTRWNRSRGLGVVPDRGIGLLDLAVANNTANTVTLLAQIPPVPLAVLSPTSLNFGSEAVGSSTAAQSITLSNNGGAALTISNVTVGPDYTQTNTCGSTVAARASCTFSVSFSPTTTGTLNESLTVTDNAAGSPQTAALTGTGTAGSVTLTPTSLNFGNQAVGTTSAAQTVTVTNVSSVTVSISSISTSVPFAETNNCGSALTAGATCMISVTYSPSVSGTQHGTLSVSDSGAGSPQTASLAGTGNGTSRA